MKTLGFVLIILQILAYVSGNIHIPDSNSLSSTLGYLIGSNIFGIAGIVFLVRADKAKQIKDKAQKK